MYFREMMEHVVQPKLLVNKKKCLANISRMAEKARTHNLIFRPHFKTHQSKEVGEWFRDSGIAKITVSSVSMACYFSDSWDDITIAFPLNPREIVRINEIDQSINLNLTIENKEALIIARQKLKRKVGVFIKIDTGYHRTGIWHSNYSEISTVKQMMEETKLMDFKGFLIHAGHTYSCSSKAEVMEIHDESLQRIKGLRARFISTCPGLLMSYGDTPSCSLADDFTGIDEIRPGNFVYYDLMQVQIGSCSLEDIAVAVACPVVAKHPERNQITIYGGAVHFSKEHILEDGRKVFGKRIQNPLSFDNRAANIGSLISLSQEHGILELEDPSEFGEIKIGDLVFILPVHSCLAANLLPLEIV